MKTTPAALSWPPTGRAMRPWRQSVRGGTREDRQLTEIEVRLPPFIAAQSLALDVGTAASLEAAMREISALDHEHGAVLDALGVLLLRTESVASSKIESLSVDLDDYARALHGIKSNSSAVAIVAATDALEAMIERVVATGAIDLAMITDAHAALMADDAREKSYAGRFRDMQNWIGGSDHSPRGALFVPPPPEDVDALMDDLIRFCNRDDVPALAQAAIAHAQFETIHPFTDGNGRIGRALINTILRRRGATSRVVVPLASALVARKERYFDLLAAYRSGDVAPLIESFARSSEVAAVESRETAKRLATIPNDWAERLGPVRSGSAAARLLALLPGRPIVSAEEAGELIGGSVSSVYAAIARLHEAEVLRPLTDRTRDQVWGAGEVLDELDDLGVRIASAALRL